MSEMRKLGDWVESYRNGYGVRPAAGEAGPIVLRIADVSSGEIDLSAPRRGAVSLKNALTYRLQPGDLLFIRVNGSREIVGRCSVVGTDVPMDTIFNDHLIRVRLKPGLNPEFARLCVSLPAARARIEEAAATSAGQLTISQQVLEQLDVPSLDMDQQLRIVLGLKAQLAEVEVARRAAAAQLAQIEQLPQKLLAQAFNAPGEDRP